MPSTRSTRRAATRTNTKRTILSALDENAPLTSTDLKLNSNNDTLPNLDILQSSSIQSILSDIKSNITANQEALEIQAAEISKKTQAEFFIGMMKLDKKIKHMTIKEFNQHFETDIIHDFDSIQISSKQPVRSMSLNKRDFKALETPVRQMGRGKFAPTPGTILRTVKKGEAVFSINGSPVDQKEEGDLIATVSKKRRGNNEEAVGFDIMIDGQSINLSDETTMQYLTPAMKNEAKDQLNVLKDQLSKLLSHLD